MFIIILYKRRWKFFWFVEKPPSSRSILRSIARWYSIIIDYSQEYFTDFRCNAIDSNRRRDYKAKSLSRRRGDRTILGDSSFLASLPVRMHIFTGRCSSRRRSRWGRRTERRIWTPCRCKSQSLDPGSTCRIERSLASPGFCSSPNRSSSVSVQRITIGDE